MKINFNNIIALMIILATISCLPGSGSDPDPANRPPVSENIDLEIETNSVLTYQLWASDYDGDEVSFFLENPPSHGTATIGLSGELIYTPNENYIGMDQITFFVSDATSSSEDYIITINVVNSMP